MEFLLNLATPLFATRTDISTDSDIYKTVSPLIESLKTLVHIVKRKYRPFIHYSVVLWGCSTSYHLRIPFVIRNISIEIRDFHLLNVTF